MESILTNSWTVGIIGGIISGFIVFFITNRLVSRRENREYQQKIRIANNELLYSIRPLIVEQKLPTIEMINSLLLSTAKKYAVQLSDLYSKNDIADDLTKEVMDNPFLTSENKLRYCALTEAIKGLGIIMSTNNSINGSLTYSAGSRTVSKEFFSVTLAIITSLTFILAIVSKGNFLTDFNSEKSSRFFVVFTAVTVLIPIVSLFLSKFLEITKERRMRQIMNSVLKKDVISKVEVVNLVNKDEDIGTP